MSEFTRALPPQQFFKSPTPAGILKSNGIDLNMSVSNNSVFTTSVAIDPITLTINECMVISSAMRKISRWSQSGVAAILGGGDIFGGEDELLSNSLGISGSFNNSTRSSANNDNPLLSSFIQLRSILSEAKSLDDIDSLTILQPFLMIIKSSSTSGQITSLALDSIAKFLNYEIISWRSKNLQASLIQINSALTHCRFEAADQGSDDAVLLKVLRLMETVITSPLSNLLPNEVVSEVIQTCLSLACNKRRSEVLRKAAEMTISLITARVFRQLKTIAPEDNVSDNIPTDFTETHLPEDIMGSARVDVGTPVPESNGQSSNKDFSDSTSEQTDEKTAEATTIEEGDLAASSKQEEDTETMQDDVESQVIPKVSKEEEHHEQPFGIGCINEFMGILISMISPSNQYQHMESTRVLALNLVTVVVEVAGKDIPIHNSLMNLMSDPISKHLLLIITTVDSPPLLQAALRLFTTMVIVLGNHLKSQIELSFTMIFNTICPQEPEKKNDNGKSNNNKATNASTTVTRMPASKEMLLESISLLWTREPNFFTNLFIDYDCDFDRSDLAKMLVDFVCKLCLPDSARLTTDNVPPICLEGLLTFVSGINERIKSNPNAFNENTDSLPKLLINKKNKHAFVKCTDMFNKKPSEGIKALAEYGFIKDASDLDEVSRFIFNKSGRLNKKVIGEYFAKPSNVEILRKFISIFDYEGLRVDEAIRLLLKTFRLPGESQQIERIVENFAERYAECQESYTPKEDEDFIKPNKDSVFILSYSIILLNTDLHNPQVKKQMTLEAYMKNLKGTFNNGNYPEWYLSKIYSSIKEKEIIMPEEHHGTDKWFDDVWHNLVSSQSSDFNDSAADQVSDNEITLYDKYVFQENIDLIIETLIQVFKAATDDHIITRLMSTIDKCVNVCLYFGIESSVDKLVSLLSDLTLLTDVKGSLVGRDDNVREEIPITQIKIEKKDEAITVSEMAVWFGRDFKAQISTVVLFRLIKKTDCQITNSWSKVLKIVLVLFENCLIDPNLFVDFQSKLKIPPLPKVKPRYVINRVKPLKDSGLLSTFSSFLKSYSDEPPEPTDQEVESTLSSIDCIKSLNIGAIFNTIAQGDNESKKLLIELLLQLAPEYNDTSKSFYEYEVLFIFEILVCFSLLIDEIETINAVLDKLHTFKNSNDLSKSSHLRLATYKLLLIRKADSSKANVVSETYKELLEFDKDFLTKHGAQCIQPVLSLADDDSWCGKQTLISEDFWKVLRVFGSIPVFSEQVLGFTETLVKLSTDEVKPENLMLILGLLDEISSIGALAAQWEQEVQKSGNTKTAGKDATFHKELIDLAKRSINLTSYVSIVLTREGYDNKNSRYPLIQALAHQCFNPCREVRSTALTTLKSTLLAIIESNPDLTPFGVFESGLFPLLTELSKPTVLQTDPVGFIDTQVEALSIVSKIFLQYVTKFEEKELSVVWFGLLDVFKLFGDIRLKNNKNETIKESGSELLKNMVLVLQSSGILKEENEDLWAKTWEKVNLLYPNLNKDLIPKSDTPVDAPVDAPVDVDVPVDTKDEISST